MALLSLAAAGIVMQSGWAARPPLPPLDVRLPAAPAVSLPTALRALRGLVPFREPVPDGAASGASTDLRAHDLAAPATAQMAPQPGAAVAAPGAAAPGIAMPAPAAQTLTTAAAVPLTTQSDATGEDAGAVAADEVEAAPAVAEVVRAPWQPPNRALAAYLPVVERWRPLVRQLIAEAWAEGRLDGDAATIDDDLVLAMIQQESLGDPDALSYVGAIGLMQVMPFTFADVMTGDRAMTCVIDRAAMWDVPSNLRAGIRYLAQGMQAFEGNRYWALAAYNAGIDTVRDFRDAGLYAVPPAAGYQETANYASVILANYLRRRPDVRMYVPDRMPAAHVPGALQQLKELDDRRGGPRPKEWVPDCG